MADFATIHSVSVQDAESLQELSGFFAKAFLRRLPPQLRSPDFDAPGMGRFHGGWKNEDDVVPQT